MVGKGMRSLWGKVKDLAKGKVVDEMWTYLFRNIKAFYTWAFSNKPFGQTSSIVLAKIATWILSTHVAIRERDLKSLWLIRPIIIPNTPNNPCQLPSQSSV